MAGKRDSTGYCRGRVFVQSPCLIWEFKCLASILRVNPKKLLGVQVPGYVFLKDGTKSMLSSEKPGADSGRSGTGCKL